MWSLNHMGKIRSTDLSASIPLRFVGPVKITGPVLDEEVSLPLATLEAPLWPSVNRGAKVSRAAGGVSVVVTDERMSRSVLVEAPTATAANQIVRELETRKSEAASIAAQNSRFAQFLDWHFQLISKLVFIRLEIKTGDAAGHNMVTAAAENLLQWVLDQFPELTYVSLSGNYCTDKKPVAVNGILGRGRHVTAEAVIPRAICQRLLRTTPEQVAELNTRKNLIGSIAAGGIRTANAHYANMLLAFYLATGQDAANIVEGSQGITVAEKQGEDLYFSVTVPHIILGTVGPAQALEFARHSLAELGCLKPREPGLNARRLAAIAGSAVWCGELSLMAALTHPHELMKAHRKIERNSK